MERLVIKSVLEPNNIRYTLTDSHYYSGLLVHGMGCYETLGDGETAHTPAYGIAVDKFTDFCLSVAAHLVDHPDTTGLYGYLIGLNTIHADAYAFLLKVHHSEETVRWFDPKAGKISKDTNKQHDKRWFEVPTFADGTPYAAWRLYWHTASSQGSMLGRYSILESFKEHAGGYFHKHNECEPWRNDLKGDYEHAFRAMQAAWAAREQRDLAKRCIAAALSNMKRAAETAAAAA